MIKNTLTSDKMMIKKHTDLFANPIKIVPTNQLPRNKSQTITIHQRMLAFLLNIPQIPKSNKFQSRKNASNIRNVKNVVTD